MSLLAGVNEASVGEYYFALRNDPSLNNAAWSTFPAVSTVDMSLNAISRCIQLEIDGQFLDATPSDLLLNGVPIATINNLSDIADWSLYPSLSGGVDMATYSIKNISGLIFTGGNVLKATGGKALVNGQDVVRLWSQCNALVDVNMGGHFLTNVGSGLGSIKTGMDDNILVNDVDVTTKWSDHPAQSNVEMGGNALLNANEVQCVTLALDSQNITATASDLYVNGIPVGSEWSTLPAVSDVSMAQHSIQDLSSIDFYYGPGASVVLNASGGDLYANGVKLAQGEDVNEWSRYAAVTDVNMNSHSISGAYKLFLNGDLNIDPAQNVLKVYGASKFYGGVEMFSSFNSISPSFISSPLLPFVTIPALAVTGQLTVGSSNASAIYGAPMYVYGGGTLDGGQTNGWSIGCLPFGGINTQRIDVLPVGISIASATFLTANVLGAGNFACGGALALAAGSYVTLEHGFGLTPGAKGVFVQDTQRNDEARMIFEFGGSVGNSVDTSASDNARMQFFGTDLFVSNIAPNTARWPRLPYLNIRSVSSLTFYSGPSGGGASMIAGPSGALTILGNVTIPSLNVPGFVTNPMNADLNAGGYNISGISYLRAGNGSIAVMNSIQSSTVQLAVSNIVAGPYGSNITMTGDVIFEGTFPNLGVRTPFINPSRPGDIVTTLTLSGYLAFGSSPYITNVSSYPSYIGPGANGYAIEIGGSAEIFGDINLTNHNLVNVGSATIDSITMEGNMNLNGYSIDNVNQIATRSITGYNGGLSLNGTNLDFAGQSAINVNAIYTRYIAGNGGLSLSNSNLDFNGFSATGMNTLNTRYLAGNGGLSLSNTDLDFASRKGTNIANPTANTDVANKQYVDAQNPASSNFGSPCNVFVPTPVAVATTTIVLPQPSRIKTTGNVVVSNTADTRRAFVYVSVDGNCNTPTASTVYSNDLLTIPTQNLTGVLSAGSHTVSIMVYPDISNNTLTSAFADLICTGGFS
jgi:hypothetical protein